jgi:glutamate transport system substrate-binding protein
MRLKRTKAALAGVGLVLSMAACGEAGGGGESSDVEAAEDCDGKFEEGTKMAELAEAGEVTVGTKFDQPGLGFKDASSDIPTGFDVEMAKLLVADLCIDPEDTDAVTWEETISDNREPYLQEGRVDLVLATYSITPERQAIVGQTGPYLVTGQRIMVKEDSKVESKEDLQGEEVCSVEGSTSIENVEKEGMVPASAPDYTQCVEDVINGTVEAMSTDGAILYGYAAENPGELKVVGPEFSEERIGVGYPKEETEMCEWINGVIQESYDDGTWADAYEATLGKGGSETPDPPELDECKTA